MENKSKPNTILLVIIIILLITGLGYLILNNSKQKENSLVNNLPQEEKNQIQTTWLKSPKFGLYYQDSLNIIEYYADKYGKQVAGREGYATFYASWGENQDSGITWGGNYTETNPTINGGGASCMDDDFGVFQYGISRVTCLKGLVARVGRTSARSSITPEDLKVFGDFILKNQEKNTNNSTTYTYNNHGFTIEFPKGFTPTETRSENGPSYSISLPIGDLVYVTDSSFWEKYNISSYTYKEDKKIGEVIFKVYEYSGATFYWYRKGDVGYQFGAVNKTGLENLLKTFKFVGWN